MKFFDRFKENKKIQKFKEYWDTFRILWNDPKSHAIIMLAFWFVLILIFALFVRLKGEDVEPIAHDQSFVFEVSSKGIKNYLREVNSYQAFVSVSDTDLYITDVNSKRLINYNNIYYYDGELYMLVNNEKILTDDKFINDINYFSVNNIYNLIKDYDEDYITIYKDNSYLISYSVPADVFFPDYESSFINILFSGINDVNKIEIRFPDNEFYDKIVIELSNVNNIDKLDVFVED